MTYCDCGTCRDCMTVILRRKLKGMRLYSRCEHFSAVDLSVGIDVVLGELFDSRGKFMKIFNVKRADNNTFVVSVGSSGHKARFNLEG